MPKLIICPISSCTIRAFKSCHCRIYYVLCGGLKTLMLPLRLVEKWIICFCVTMNIHIGCFIRHCQPGPNLVCAFLLGLKCLGVWSVRLLHNSNDTDYRTYLLICFCVTMNIHIGCFIRHCQPGPNLVCAFLLGLKCLGVWSVRLLHNSKIQISEITELMIMVMDSDQRNT